MPLDFPSNPINGQTYDNYYWDASSNAWRSSGTKAGLQTRTTALELANATTNKSGLVPIIPSSLGTSSGTATYSSTTGLITVSGSSGFGINDVFTSAYTNYRIIMSGSMSVSGVLQMRFKSGTSDISSGNYYYNLLEANSTMQVYRFTAQTIGRIGYFNNGQTANVVMDVFSPAPASESWLRASFTGSDGLIWLSETANRLATADACSGIAFLPQSGTFSGTVQVYGYR